MATLSDVNGAGVGLRRGLLDEFEALTRQDVDFMEVAPENWIGVGGRYGKRFASYAERYPMLCHGLSLSIGSPAPLDIPFLKKIKVFLEKHDVRLYSEHLSYCSDDGHLYDLMPIPFTDEAVTYVAQRIVQVQDILERELIIENVSAYAAPGKQMSEATFINDVLTAANCGLLLDVNNVYVNSINHAYDAIEFINAMPTQHLRYVHIAGHYNEADDLIVDTHGADVIDEVWSLLAHTYKTHGVLPTLLERDFNYPPIEGFKKEFNQIKALQATHAVRTSAGKSHVA